MVANTVKRTSGHDMGSAAIWLFSTEDMNTAEDSNNSGTDESSSLALLGMHR
jgi:hypothetical protein